MTQAKHKLFWTSIILATSLTTTERVVLLYLLWRQGGNGHSWPKQETIAKDLGLSRRTVQLAIQVLQERGWLQVVWPSGPGRGHPCEYAVTVPENAQPIAPFVPRKRAMGCAFSKRKGANIAPKKAQPVAHLKKNNNIEHIHTPPTPPEGEREKSLFPGGVNDSHTTKAGSNGELAVRFDRFWEIWPKKKDKASARDVWGRLKPTEDLTEAIIVALRRQKMCRQWQEAGGQYIPGPAKWLRHRRWEDEIPDSEIRRPDTMYDRDGNILSAPCSQERLAELQRKGLFPSWPDETPEASHDAEGNIP